MLCNILSRIRVETLLFLSLNNISLICAHAHFWFAMSQLLNFFLVSYWQFSESNLCKCSRVIIDYLLTGESWWLTKHIPSPDCPYMDYRCTRLLSVWLTSTRTTCIKRPKQLFTSLNKNTCICEQPVESCKYIVYRWHVTKQHGGSLLNFACWNAELLSLYSHVSTNQLIELLTELWRANPNLFK